MKNKITLLSSLAVGLWANNSMAQTLGTGTYIPGNWVGVGIDNNGGFEGLTLSSSTPTPAAVHPRSGTGYFGFTANPLLTPGWTNFNGDFFTPGTPENGWGLEIGGPAGVKTANNRQSSFGDVPIPSTQPISYQYIDGCYIVDWGGDYVGGGYNLHVDVQYHLKEDDLYYTTTVRIRNNGTANIPELYFYRNVDPDNNVSLTGDYSTFNTILYQPTPACNKAVVTAQQSASGSSSASYMGFGAIGDAYRVCYGGFSNRDGSDLWNFGPGFTGTMGSTTTGDIGISLSHKTVNLAPGETSTIKFLVILDATQLDEALNSYMSFEYLGSIADPPSCQLNIDTAVSCSGNPITIEFDGSIEGNYEWSWSPATGLDTTAGNVVQAFPSDTTLYTITGTSISSCYTSSIISQIVVIPAEGPEIVMDDPGIHCIDFDLADLVFSDANGIPGTTVLFLDNEPTNAGDTSIFTGTTIYPGDSVYLFISEPTLGCYDYEFVNVTWVDGFSFDADVVNPICMASNGSIEIINVVGASGTVSYQWVGGPSTPLYGSIPSGTYTIHMEDAAGCTADTTINFPNITTMTSSIVLDSPAECGSNSGAFTVTATTGTPTYNYDIGAGPQVSGSFTGLAPGLHVIEITDNAGCLIFDSIMVPDTSTIALALGSVTPVHCGTSDGTITVVGSGGVGPYTYTIGPDTQTSAVFDSLSSGIYPVIITGVGGCTDTLDVTVIDNLTMTASLVDTTSAICGGGGGVEVDAINGGFVYTYTLSGGGGSNTTGIFTNLNPGSYTVTVTSGTCTQTVPFTIVSNQTLNATLVDTNAADCANPNGSVIVTAANGVAAGTYNFTVPGHGSQTNGNFTGLTAGSYIMTITSGTCSVNVPFIIANDPGNLSLQENGLTNENCGMNNGAILTSATGGTTPYEFTLNGGAVEPDGNFTGLNNGIYIVSVEDVNGCIDTLHFTLNQIPIDISLGEDIIACNSYTIPGDGTTGTYLWSTGDNGSSITVTTSGTYWLSVSRPDIGCVDIDSINVTLLENPIIVPANIFTPNNDGINDEFTIHGMFVTTYHIAIFNRWGQEVFSSDDVNKSWDGKTPGGNPADDGVYMYIIEYDNPCESPSLQTRTGSIQLAR